MHRLFWFPLSFLLLAGCATGYAIDYVRPKTFLIGPQLIRYGLDPADAQCVGADLGGNLSVWQLRQLSDAAGAVKAGGVFPSRLTLRELRWVASHVKDEKISAGLDRAVNRCGLNSAGIPDGLKIKEIIAGDLPPPSGAPGPGKGAVQTGLQNGPGNYQPSEDLWAAFEAYEKGDLATAARRATAAAEAGDSGAQQFLGGLYASGEGVPVNQEQAGRYFALAAEQGWSEAMNNLGKAYQTGQGVPRDNVEALKWYLLASHRPTEDAKLVEANIVSVSGEMSIEQIGQAAALAKKWEQDHAR